LSHISFYFIPDSAHIYVLFVQQLPCYINSQFLPVGEHHIEVYSRRRTHNTFQLTVFRFIHHQSRLHPAKPSPHPLNRFMQYDLIPATLFWSTSFSPIKSTLHASARVTNRRLRCIVVPVSRMCTCPHSTHNFTIVEFHRNSIPLSYTLLITEYQASMDFRRSGVIHIPTM